MTTDTSTSEQMIDDDDEELDLIKLVATNANDSNQYLVFVGSNGELYAKNVSKIEELLIYKDLNISKNSDPNHLILGTADIRGQMTTIVNFDKWMGNEVLAEEQYELLIIASYGNRRFAIVVKSVEQITTIEPDDMTDNSSDNDKASFISKMTIAGKERLCTIFDGDKMLLDIYEDIENRSISALENIAKGISSEKIVLFADDSKFVRKMVGGLFDKLHLNYRIYHDGKGMTEQAMKYQMNKEDNMSSMQEEMAKMQPDDVGLVITDIEMPKMGGREVITHIRENSDFNDINIIVHTNMSNNLMSNELIEAGSSKIIGKIDMEELSTGIKELIR